MPKGIPLTEAEQDRRRHEIFQASVKLFLKNGFQETSMQEVAKAAGIGKSTLYDYFKTKEDILVWGMEDEFLDLSDAARDIFSQPGPAVEKLREWAKMHLEFLAESKEFYLKLSFEVQRLSIESQKRIQVRRHTYQDMICRVIEDGIREGAFRKVDSLLTTRTLLSMLTPTVFTSRPSGTPQQMLDNAFDIVLKGIQT